MQAPDAIQKVIWTEKEEIASHMPEAVLEAKEMLSCWGRGP